MAGGGLREGGEGCGVLPSREGAGGGVGWREHGAQFWRVAGTGHSRLESEQAAVTSGWGKDQELRDLGQR